MELNWFESILYGLFSGLADVLPVSAQAHRLILLKLFGESGESVFLRLLIHIGTLAALYYCSQNQIIRYLRARKLAMIPKRKRKRPLDTRTMDEALIRNWNAKVSDEDTVYVLGDISWYNDETTARIFNSLKGRKILIKGNHDRVHGQVRRCFDEITDYKEIMVVAARYRSLTHPPL